jgi:hypothetical protein
MSIDPQIVEAILLACLEPRPMSFQNIDEAEARRVKTAIHRANATKSAVLRYPVTRKHFLCGCLDFTDRLSEEHLIVGYGFRFGNTTDIVSINHVVGQRGRVTIPQGIQQEISRHHFHRSDAEVIVFHNHPRVGDEPAWFYTLKVLLEDIPIASNADREQVRHHAYNTVGMARQFLGQGRVLFFLGESGLVKAFNIPSLLPFLDQIGGNASRTA